VEHGERRSVGESGRAATPRVSESMLMDVLYTFWSLSCFSDGGFRQASYLKVDGFWLIWFMYPSVSCMFKNAWLQLVLPTNYFYAILIALVFMFFDRPMHSII
jgi:hypothetical protein